jgi:hypothetical protein
VELDRYKATDRVKARIYFLVEEGDKKYIMDLQGNKYLPAL